MTDPCAALVAAESIALGQDGLADVARNAVAAALGLADPVLPEDDRAHAFAQQVTLDVASVTDEQRAAALAALGREAFGFLQVVYVSDLGTRVRLALRQLYGRELPAPQPVAGDLWAAVEELMRAVARRSALDPVTTELVRLRGARAHDCRLCRSLRDVRALDAGGDEALYDALDDPTSDALTGRQRAAVALVDAMVWQPTAFPEGVVDDVHRELTEDEGTEVVLDVMRNAGNKVAVALAADAARVTEGVELYSVDETGEPVYGITR